MVKRINEKNDECIVECKFNQRFKNGNKEEVQL